jgi:hypothetical protein
VRDDRSRPLLTCWRAWSQHRKRFAQKMEMPYIPASAKDKPLMIGTTL